MKGPEASGIRPSMTWVSRPQHNTQRLTTIACLQIAGFLSRPSQTISRASTFPLCWCHSSVPEVQRKINNESQLTLDHEIPGSATAKKSGIPQNTKPTRQSGRQNPPSWL